MPSAALTGAAFVIQTLIALYLVIGEPLYGKVAYRRLLDALDRDHSARIRFYRGIIILEWALVFLVLLTLRMAGGSAADIGLRPAAMGSDAAVLVAGLSVGLVAPVVLAAVSRSYRQVIQRQGGSVRGLIPSRGDERWWFALVAVTAGVCEETLFRGFLMAYLTALVPGIPVWAAVAASGIIFGMAHLYQGWGGVLTTGVVGLLMASGRSSCTHWWICGSWRFRSRGATALHEKTGPPVAPVSRLCSQCDLCRVGVPL
ncbi:CPBP family glutamic-type intramembrane protease [Symbiobacterium terraclitae]|uniref:CPBP family glutamic-type intramembrane protease n=1 Tax=Symbiobacterium terraclitae TaxID=557451 RepID=UPI0035B521E7